MNDVPGEVVIGLEVHVQLLTATKLFCRCSTKFGAPPNTQTCPVCIGLPGSLPVMNATAFDLALKTAVALHCEIPPFTKWDRKNYYYPDLPKGYQISQFDLPLSHDGWLEISDPKERFAAKKVGIIRAHLEEDAGKSMHDEQSGRADSRIDLNRTGTPLLEIVSRPDLRSPLEARTYLSELKLLLTYLGVSDCNMQEGSLRVDANVNLHIDTPAGKVATPIVEVKNMNSFRAAERALEFETQRQYETWLETGRKLGEVSKETRGWDDQAQVTKAQRSKEESSDYRYFPDPDLVPVTISPSRLDQVRASLGELPSDVRERLQREHEISASEAEVLVSQGRGVVDYFVELATTSGDSKRSSNWVQQLVFATLNERGMAMHEFPISPARLAELIHAVRDGQLDHSRVRDIYAVMLDSGQGAHEAMQNAGVESVDETELRDLCRDLLQANPHIVSDVQSGKQKAVSALIGQAKKRNPNVNPNRVREICLELIQQM